MFINIVKILYYKSISVKILFTNKNYLKIIIVNKFNFFNSDNF